ncbi:hypothetical protein BRDID11002_59130 [Bradyrhizobium diazoefficiens]
MSIIALIRMTVDCSIAVTPVLLLALDRPIEDTRAGADRGERIAQIVTENGDELLAKLRCFVLKP